MTDFPPNPSSAQEPGQQQPQVIYVQEKKRGGCLKWVGIIGGVLVLIVILAMIFGGDGDGDGDSASSGSSASKEKEKGKDGDEPLELGKTYTSKKGLEVTVHSFAAESNELGDQLLCSDVDYVNNGDKEANFEGYGDWEIQDPNGVITDPSIWGDDTLLSGKVAPGGNLSGRICFEGEASGEYLIKFEPLFSWGGENARWKATI